jgi:LEA14-like dessication related protein
MVLSCAPVNQPEFRRVEKINIDAGESGIVGTFDLVLFNKNKSGLRLRSAEANVYINDKLLGTASLLKPLRIQAGTEMSIPLRASFRKENIISAVPSALNLLFGSSGEQARVVGNIRIRKMLWYRKFSFELKQEIDKNFLKELYN